VLSRLGLILFVTAILYAGIGAVIGFHNAGNLLLLALLGVVGALSMIALGLTFAARFSSEELVGGTAQRAHLADDAAVGDLVLARRITALGAMGGACLSSDPTCSTRRAR